MNRLLNSVLLVLFVLGVVVCPGLHEATCSEALYGDECGTVPDPQGSGACSVSLPPKTDGGHGHFWNDWCADTPVRKSHDAAHCTICQMAGTAVVAASPAILWVPNGAIVSERLLPAIAPLLRPAHALPFSCGPPA